MPVSPQPSEPSRVNRRLLLGGALAAFALPLAACSEKSDLAKQAAAGDSKGFIAGDGSVEEFKKGSRGDAVQFKAPLFDGTDVSAEQYRGKVLILNFWYAACGPCRKEAPTLVALAEKYKSQKVEFLGVNVRDEAPTAEAFDRTFKVPYPSVRDIDGKVLMAMTKYVSPTAVPTTLVIDPEGKVAARILGVADKSTLDTLIRDNIA
jgi:thiol-disulfide isomerase/thioredoxin